MIHFDPETHTYTLPSGEILPSVTQIIRPLDDFSMVPRDMLQRAGAFGTGVHTACQLLLEDALDWDELDEALKGPVEAFGYFWAEHDEFDWRNVVVEHPLSHDTLKYAGTPDLIFPEDIIDIKTRAMKLERDAVQLEGYDMMLPALWPRHRWVLEIWQDGTYVLKRCEKKQSKDMFMTLLKHHRSTVATNKAIAAWQGK